MNVKMGTDNKVAADGLFDGSLIKHLAMKLRNSAEKRPSSSNVGGGFAGIIKIA